MKKKKQEEEKEINAFVVLIHLRDLLGSKIRRIDIAKKLGLCKSSITLIIQRNDLVVF